MSRIYSSERDFQRAEYWNKVKFDLFLTPFIALVIFIIALFSINFAAMAVVFDIFHWIVGRFSKSGFKMTLPAFSVALTLDFVAIYAAAKFF